VGLLIKGNARSNVTAKFDVGFGAGGGINGAELTNGDELTNGELNILDGVGLTWSGEGRSPLLVSPAGFGVLRMKEEGNTDGKRRLSSTIGIIFTINVVVRRCRAKILQ
jgi:hypothetical protein